MSWIDRGAQLVGGCCGIRPEHIRALADMLPDGPPEDARRAGRPSENPLGRLAPRGRQPG
ncbi:MAG: homocysteine S-methyltransferase family protein [Gaiellaceae bacterium]